MKRPSAALAAFGLLLFPSAAACSDSSQPDSKPETSSVSTSSEAFSGGKDVPTDVKALADSYNQGDTLVFNCAYSKSPGLARAECIGTFSKTIGSLRAAAEGLSATKARGDLLQSIDTWVADRDQYVEDRCYFRGVQVDTSNPSADCDAQLQGLEDQWNVMLDALGF